MQRGMAYAKLWLKNAIQPSFRHADVVSSVVGILIPLAVKLVPSWRDPLTELTWQIPLGIFLCLAFGRVAIAPYRIHIDDLATAARLRQERDAATSELNASKVLPPLSVEWQAGPPFVEVYPGQTLHGRSTVISPNGQPGHLVTQWRQKMCRVRIVNPHERAVNNVRVVVARTEPPTPTLNEVPLHFMHDNPTDSSLYLKSCDIEPLGHKDVDVVFQDGTRPNALVFHTIQGIPQDIAVGDSILVIRVTASNALPSERRFMLRSTQNDELALTLTPTE